MRVALVQMNSRDEKAENLERAEMLIAQAAAWGSDLVVLPELWTYLGPRKRHAEMAEPIPGETTEFLGRLSSRYGFWLVGGSFLEAVEGQERAHNTSVVLNPDGELVARYRKLHMFDVEVEGNTYEESATMAPGEEVVVASLAGVPVGLTLCYDLRFPELYRRLAAWGARLVTVPAAFTMETGRDHWEVLLRARAIENQVYVLAAGQCGTHPPGTRLLRELDDRGSLGHRRGPGRLPRRRGRGGRRPGPRGAHPEDPARAGPSARGPLHLLDRPPAPVSGGLAPGTEGAMPGNLDLKELEDLVRQDEIDTVLTVFPDVQGRLMGKRVVGRHFLGHVAGEGVHACAYLLTVDVDMEPLPGYKFASWATGYQDMKAVPDLGTLRRIPWLEKTALVFCDLYTEEGEPIEVSPRRILQRQVERAAKLGYRLMVASELELYLFKESFAEARAKRYHGLTPVSQYLEDYHILQTTKEEGLVRAIRNGMEAAAVPVEFSKGEWGCGQEEINLRYAEPIEMADRHTLYKHGVKEIAHAQGSSITFMAKYDMGAAGSSFHLHSSLWDRTGKKSLFSEKGKRFGSALYGHWLAGQMAMAKEFAYFYAPYVNSYKRYQAGSFAPTRIVAGWDNRTCGFRICGEGSGFRVENRIPGADANPYLAFAATIAAGLHGIQKKLPAPQVYEGNAYEDPKLPQVPKTLREAIAELERSRVAREAFGDEVVEHYLHTARLEQQTFDQVVTDWELMRGFERI